MFHLIGNQIEKVKAQPELKSRSNPALRARSSGFFNRIITFMNTHDESPSRRSLELRQDTLRACLNFEDDQQKEKTSGLPAIRLAMCNSAARLKTARTQPHLAAS
jgi:hypothetical protein